MASKFPRPILYRSSIDLPEARSGAYHIQHAELTGDVPVVGMREAFLTGRQPASVKLKEPLRIHRLVDDNHGVLMSDEPQELRQIGEWLNTARPRGRVLVGGLGLGIIATVLAERREVEAVDVIEISTDVVNLVGHANRGRYNIVVADLFEFLRGVPVFIEGWLWDHAFIDLWQGTSETCWWSTVFPLKRLIHNRFGHQRVHYWAEDIMLGQVESAIMNGNRSWHYTPLPKTMTPNQTRNFTRNVGLPGWEARWGKLFPKGAA